MNDESKKKLADRYQRELNKGERFWPDSIYKDLLVSLGIFILLVLLATFIGVPAEPKADPSDTAYIPRPEWYFLFLFKFLALYGQIPLLGKIEWIATVLVPVIAVLVLTLMPFIDRSPSRYYGKRILPISIMAIVVVGIVTLTLIADIPTVSPNGSTFIGVLQAIGNLLVPGVGVVLLFLMSFVFKSTPTKSMIWTTGLTAALMVGFTGGVLCLAPKAGHRGDGRRDDAGRPDRCRAGPVFGELRRMPRRGRQGHQDHRRGGTGRQGDLSHQRPRCPVHAR